jgi:hypothetical protein
MSGKYAVPYGPPLYPGGSDPWADAPASPLQQFFAPGEPSSYSASRTVDCYMKTPSGVVLNQIGAFSDDGTTYKMPSNAACFQRATAAQSASPMYKNTDASALPYSGLVPVTNYAYSVPEWKGGWSCQGNRCVPDSNSQLTKAQCEAACGKWTYDPPTGACNYTEGVAPGTGEYATQAACLAANPFYACGSGTPGCTAVPNGTAGAYINQAACTAACVSYNCGPTGCVAVQNSGGKFPSLAACQSPTTGCVTYNCGATGCVPVYNSTGTHATQAACTAACVTFNCNATTGCVTVPNTTGRYANNTLCVNSGCKCRTNTNTTSCAAATAAGDGCYWCPGSGICNKTGDGTTCPTFNLVNGSCQTIQGNTGTFTSLAACDAARLQCSPASNTCAACSAVNGCQWCATSNACRNTLDKATCTAAWVGFNNPSCCAPAAAGTCAPSVNWPNCDPGGTGLKLCSQVTKTDNCCISDTTTNTSQNNCPAGFTANPSASNEWCTDTRNAFTANLIRYKCRRVC